MIALNIHKSRYRDSYLFWFITLSFLGTRWFIFTGFKGSDDLHYALLASNLIKGRYDPFNANDIYSGRIILIAWQAFIYKAGGISAFTTQIGTLFIVILSCWLTVFKLIENRNAATTIIASMLFYCNPVLTTSTLGILPDVYIMLSGIILLLLVNKSVFEKRVNRRIMLGCITGLVIAVSLFIKETILVFLVFAILLSIFRNEHAYLTALSVLGSFVIMGIVFGFMYHYFTGDVYFKLKQIRNSSYLNDCSYEFLPARHLFIRLTYGAWQEFIVKGFYPVILAAFMLIIQKVTARRSLNQDLWAVYFTFLLLIALYVPFSLSSYQPLCADARQFLFLLPPGVVLSTGFITGALTGGKARTILLSSSLPLLMICLVSTLNKWQWMIYAMICAWAVSLYIMAPWFKRGHHLVLAGILWLSLTERYFLFESHWFNDMIKLHKKLDGRYFYFHDHDNMMHWKLLNRFDEINRSYYNLEKHPFHVFKRYYQTDTISFHPGWLIVNKAYTVSAAPFFKNMDSLQHRSFFARQSEIGDLNAFYIDHPDQLAFIKKIN